MLGLIFDPLVTCGLVGFAWPLIQAAEAKEQTANNHGTNLRDDLDETRVKVDQISELATSTNGLVRQLGSEIVGIRCDLTAMWDRQPNEERAHTVLVESSKTDHERIWKAIDELEDQA
jgi:hypothetical protein